MSSTLETFVRVTERWVESCAAVGAEHSAIATPCAGWTVIDLIDHVTGGNVFTVEILAGASGAEALDAARSVFADGADPVERSVATARRQQDAVERIAFDGEFDHVAGRLSGEQIVALRMHDVAIHTWDLHQAVDPTKGLDPVYVRWAIEDLATPGSIAARHMATGFNRPTKPFELLLAFGRVRRPRRSQ